MAATILPANLYEIASGIENQAASLGTGIKLLYDQLQVSHSDSESVAESISKMYFVAEALDDLKVRLDALSATAYALHNESKSPPPHF